MDPIKEAFQKVKQEIDYLLSELESLRNQLDILKIQVANTPTNQQSNQPTHIPTQTSSENTFSQVNQQEIQHISEVQQTNTSPPTNIPTHLPTQNVDFKALKPQILSVSTGNEGVPTNQPTNQQTNQHPFISPGKPFKSSFNDKINHLEKVSEILSSLDELKKEVRIKFKRLTEQEMLVYSTIYQLEDQGLSPDYSLLSEKLGLTEISIRDYVRKIISKGIPLDKIKENNKKILLSIPKDLKKIASLNTILQLRQI